jgi:sulfide:quinone oxidoreductase
VIVTPEGWPLEAFGRTGAALATCLLEEAGIELITGADPYVPGAGRLLTAPGTAARTVDRVVALPRVEGLAISGLPADAGGFLPVDASGRVIGAQRVYAAGDGTAGARKQGGLAAQQAETAVGTLLDDLGRPAPEPAEAPALRAVLVTGDEVWYLRRAVAAPDGEVSRSPLWWPPGKIAGRRLATFLDAERAGGVDQRCGTAVRRRAAILRGGDGRVTLQRLERDA